MSKDYLRYLRFAVAMQEQKIVNEYLYACEENQEFGEAVGILELVYFCNHGVYP
jgi:hypothetical protein